MNAKKVFLTLLIIFIGLSAYSQSFSLGMRHNYYDGNVYIYDILNGNDIVGWMFFINRGQQHADAKIYADYLAATQGGNSVYQRFVNLRNHKNVVFGCSGSLALSKSNKYVPVGLTIDHGIIVNENIEKNEYDGLVIVYPQQGGGGIAVSNLDYGDLTYGSNTNVDIRQSRNKQAFIDWAKRNGATVFQTQLLAYKNQIMPDLQHTTQTAERRFLMAMRNKNSGTLYHVIVYVETGVTLYDLTKWLVDNFTRSNKIYWIINLDTGMFDVQRFYDINGTEIDHYSVGSLNSDDDVSNMIFWYIP